MENHLEALLLCSKKIENLEKTGCYEESFEENYCCISCFSGNIKKVKFQENDFSLTTCKVKMCQSDSCFPYSQVISEYFDISEMESLFFEGEKEKELICFLASFNKFYNRMIKKYEKTHTKSANTQ